MGATVINIPALIASLAELVHDTLYQRATDPFNVHYDFGRYLEVTRNLVKKDGATSMTTREKYPLIWLVVPYTVTESIIGNGCVIKGMQIIIATRTIPESTTPRRIDANFIPRLWPIYDELRRQIDRSGYFNDIDFNNVHERTDQPYWDGKDSSNGGGANLFNDYIDAVQLKNIRLEVNEQTCDRFRLIRGVMA